MNKMYVWKYWNWPKLKKLLQVYKPHLNSVTVPLKSTFKKERKSINTNPDRAKNWKEKPQQNLNNTFLNIRKQEGGRTPSLHLIRFVSTPSWKNSHTGRKRTTTRHCVVKFSVAPLTFQQRPATSLPLVTCPTWNLAMISPASFQMNDTQTT